MGQTGSPVTRSKTKTSPCLVSWVDGLDAPAVHRDRGQHRLGRQVVVPDPVVDDLEVPRPLAVVRVERHEALREEVVAEPLPAVVDVGGVADGQEHQLARLVDGHPGPHVGGAHVAPRLVLPRLAAELALLGDGVETPDEGAGAGVVGADVAGRGAPVDDAVADGAADYHQVLVHDRRRVELEVAAVDGPDEIAAQVDHAVVAERSHHLAGRRVEAEEPVPAREEDAQVVAVSPHGDATVAEAAAEGGHAVGVGAGVEDPSLGPGLGVEGGDAVVVGADVGGAVEHNRRAREAPRDGAELLPRAVRGAPRPRRLEPVDGVRGQGVGGRIPRVRGVAADVRPLHRAGDAGRLRLGRCFPRGRGDQQERRPEHVREPLCEMAGYGHRSSLVGACAIHEREGLRARWVSGLGLARGPTRRTGAAGGPARRRVPRDDFLDRSVPPRADAAERGPPARPGSGQRPS